MGLTPHKGALRAIRPVILAVRIGQLGKGALDDVLERIDLELKRTPPSHDARTVEALRQLRDAIARTVVFPGSQREMSDLTDAIGKANELLEEQS